MCYLAERFYDVALFFDDVSERCMSAKYWFWDFPGLGGLGDIFESLEDYFFHIYWDLRQAAFAIDDWWDVIDETRDWFYDLYDYAYGWLKDRANAAYVWATWAMDWASQAWEKASAALTEIPYWVLTKLADAYDAALAIAGVIGTTLSQIIQFVRDYAVIIYQTIVENIYNTYQTFKEYITNVYETITNVFNTFVTNVIGVTEAWVSDFVNFIVAPIAAQINLVSYWFDDIQDFFNDPLGWLLDRFGDWFFGQEK